MIPPRDINTIMSILDDVFADVYEHCSFSELEPAMNPDRFLSTVMDSFSTHWAAIPDEPLPLRTSVTVGTQCPQPGDVLPVARYGASGTFSSVPTPGVPFALRCAANTLASGNRCKLQAFYPYTLCAVHFGYFTVRGDLPTGGEFRPYQPHPDDWQNGPSRNFREHIPRSFLIVAFCISFC